MSRAVSEEGSMEKAAEPTKSGEEITQEQLGLPASGLVAVLKFFKSFTKREWVLLVATLLFALIGAVATASSGVVTQIIVIQATASKELALTQSAEGTAVAFDPIERRGTYVFPVDDTKSNSRADYTVGTFLVNKTIASRYIVNYSIDKGNAGWAGINIGFTQPVDASRYNGLRFTIQFKDDHSPVYLDVVGKDGKWSRTKLGDGTYGEPGIKEQTIVIPLKTLTNTDLTKVTYINIISDAGIAPDTAEHVFTIGQFEFVDTSGK